MEWTDERKERSLARRSCFVTPCAPSNPLCEDALHAFRERHERGFEIEFIFAELDQSEAFLHQTR